MKTKLILLLLTTLLLFLTGCPDKKSRYRVKKKESLI